LQNLTRKIICKNSTVEINLIIIVVFKVSRAFGDIEAKLPQFGGNPNVLIAKPEITKIKLNSEHDFLVLGCK